MKTRLSFNKNYLIMIIFTFSLISVQTKAQCPPGDLNITTQQDIIDFQTDYPSCTMIEGDLNIDGFTSTSLTDLSGLSQITSVGGTLNIYNNNALTNLSGLENITTVGNKLDIIFNDGITNMSGLNSLQSIGTHLYIRFNDNLVNLNGLDNLTTISGADYGLYIVQNESMTSLDGIENLTTTPYIHVISNDLIQNLDALANVNASTLEYLRIVYNDALTTCDFPAICSNISDATFRTSIYYNADGCNFRWEIESACGQTCPTGDDWYIDKQNELDGFATLFPTCTAVPGDLDIRGIFTSSIDDLSSLSQITSVGGSLYIYNNDDLPNLNGLNNITTIGDRLDIYYNDEITDLSGLSSLQSTGSSINIRANNNLVNLNGLSSLTTIGGDLSSLNVYDNDAMTSLDGIENLYTVPYIYVRHNELIQDLDALANLNASIIESVEFSNNPVLSICNNTAICSFLADASSSTNIFSNTIGCNSRTEIETECH